MSDQFDTPEFDVEGEDEAAQDEGFGLQENSLEGDERTVTIRTSGTSEVVAWHEGITLQNAFEATSFLMSTRTDFYLDNTIIEMSTVLPAGAIVTAIGATQKGG